MEFSFWTPEYFLLNNNECLKIIQNENNWNNIPFLNYSNLCELKDNSLVRFRGVIQDMYNPEIYLDEYEIISESGGVNVMRKQNGKYRDLPVLMPGEKLNHESELNRLGDRKVYFAITIPGLNNWVKEIEKNKYLSKYETTRPIVNEISSAPKRSHPENSEDMEVNEVESHTKKKVKETRNKNTTQSTSLSPEFILNSPIPSRPSKPCMVKIYTESDDYELGNVIDVIGFLSVDPQLDGIKNSESDEDMENQFITTEEIQIQHPPPSLVPRLHAIYVRKLTNYNPLITLEGKVNDDYDYNSEENLKSIYKDLRLALSQCLFGDEMAADYLLCHLISSVYAWTEIKPLGQFTLNISHIPQNLLGTYPEKLYRIIDMLLPASHYFAATLDNLNTLQFFPKEDKATNKLVSGHLQLAPHTHFVFDETKLTPGKLDESGLNAIKYLSHLIDSQEIKCIFQYFQTEYKCDIPILIISEVKSLLPKNYHIPLNIKYPESIEMINETFKATEFFFQSKISRIRNYLSILKTKRFIMPEGDEQISKLIQNDFVQLRREKNIDTEYLHNLMVLSRLIGLSSGKSTLDENIWKRAIHLEDCREKRIAELQKQQHNKNKVME